MINNESIDLVLNQMEKDISSLKAMKARRIRNDKGVKRTNYKSNLPLKYRQYLNRANKKQIPFELSVNEFNAITLHPCVYCGSVSRIGVDRKDNLDGYTIENAQPCCFACNMMKYTHSEEDFIRQVRKIAAYRK